MSTSITAEATGYVRKMVERETRGNGDVDNAQSRLSVKYGLPYWSLDHIRRGRAKRIDVALFFKLRSAYLAYCQHQISALQIELAIEKAKGSDVPIEDLEREVSVLAETVRSRIEGKT